MTTQPTTVEATERNEHHTVPTHELVLLLGTHAAQGLTDADAHERLERFGPNELPPMATSGPLIRFMRQFNHPLIYVLLAAGAVTAALGEEVDSAVIFGVVLVNAIVGFVQESRAEAALGALRSMVHTEALVIRDGRRRSVPSAELVPGDVAVVEAGDKVPADLRVLELAELQVDESALTGESVPVTKDEVVLPATTPVADRRNMLYSGTLVTHGSGIGVVVATGHETELGEIHRLVGTAENLATPLTRKLAWFSKILTVAILALAAVTFGIGVVRGQPPTEMFTAAVALAVGAIPEGLPAAVTITLAIGVKRMARRRAVIRRMPAVETLGSTTVVCSDKTGTLTENQMTVRAIWTPAGTYDVTGSGYRPEGAIAEADDRPSETDTSTTDGLRAATDAPATDATSPLDEDEALRWTLVASAACNDARLVQDDDDAWKVIGDPTEGAMLVAARKAGLPPEQLADDLRRVRTIPFSSERRSMTTLHEHAGDDGRIVLTKGAVEAIVERCTTWIAADGHRSAIDRDAVLAAADGFARDGLRVLATAMGTIDADAPFDASHVPSELALAGLQAMLDPPRPAAIDAVASCHTAGIDVKMITGDHAATATAIAERLGILEDGRPDDVLTGIELAELDEDRLSASVERAQVFARVSPEQKLRLVEGLQARHHVVAMTGDGVNDAPALQQADIGIAMGKGGTEVAKEAADMVLTDDDFATIEAAVEEGRGVFDNLTKFIVWTLPTNMGEGLVILSAILLGATLPLLPVQILWINMTTAVLLGLMLAFEPREPDIMQRPPRDPQRPLLTRPLVERILLVSAMLVAGSWWLFTFEKAGGASAAEARTAAMNLFVVGEAYYLFSCRSLQHSVWRLGLFSNRWVLGGVALQAVAQAAITYAPFMQRVFSTAPIGGDVWLRIFAAALAVPIVVALDKRRRRGRI